MPGITETSKGNNSLKSTVHRSKFTAPFPPPLCFSLTHFRATNVLSSGATSKLIYHNINFELIAGFLLVLD